MPKEEYFKPLPGGKETLTVTPSGSEYNLEQSLIYNLPNNLTKLQSERTLMRSADELNNQQNTNRRILQMPAGG